MQMKLYETDLIGSAITCIVKQRKERGSIAAIIFHSIFSEISVENLSLTSVINQ
jgi:aspartate/glutamate racemase